MRLFSTALLVYRLLMWLRPQQNREPIPVAGFPLARSRETGNG